MDPSTVPKDPIVVRRWILVSSMSHLKGKKTIASKITGLVSVVCWCLNSHPPSQKKITPSPSRLHHRLAVRRTWHRCNRNQRIALAEVFTPVFLIPKAAPEINPKRVYNSPKLHSFQWLCCEHLMSLRNMMDAMWFFHWEMQLGRCSQSNWVTSLCTAKTIWYQCVRKLLCLLIMHEGDDIWINSRCFQFLSRWWFQIFYFFSPLLGEMIQFHYIVFFRWVGSTTN